jgi:hypothetical protein
MWCGGCLISSFSNQPIFKSAHFQNFSSSCPSSASGRRNYQINHYQITKFSNYRINPPVSLLQNHPSQQLAYFPADVFPNFYFLKNAVRFFGGGGF